MATVSRGKKTFVTKFSSRLVIVLPTINSWKDIYSKLIREYLVFPDSDLHK